MGFWIMTLLLNLLIPIIILIMGILYLKKPLSNINWTSGYRTKRSVQNQETWKFAQRHFGCVCCRWGIAFVLLALFLMLSVLGENEKNIALTGTVIGTAEGFLMAYILVPTERALKRRFGLE